jgi:hypothetical protein
MGLTFTTVSGVCSKTPGALSAAFQAMPWAFPENGRPVQPDIENLEKYQRHTGAPAACGRLLPRFLPPCWSATPRSRTATATNRNPNRLTSPVSLDLSTPAGHTPTLKTALRCLFAPASLAWWPRCRTRNSNPLLTVSGAFSRRAVESRMGASTGACGVAPFPLPAHQTGRADLPHPAFRLTSSQTHERATLS